MDTGGLLGIQSRRGIRSKKLATHTDPVVPPSETTYTGSEDDSFNRSAQSSANKEEEEKIVTDDSDDSEPTGPTQRENHSRQLRSSVEPEPLRQKSPEIETESSAPETVNPPFKNTALIILVAVAVLAVSTTNWTTRSDPRKEASVRQSCKHFLQLHSKYPNTDNMLWATLTVGVERAVNDPGEPATFIFLYDSASVGQSLLDDVAHITIDCFGHGDAIWRTSADFKPAEIAADYGTVLNRHRAELQSQGVLVVRDLDRVPPIAAKVFFTICDSYEPLVRKAVIFFTIDISQRTNQSQQSPTSMAEKILKDLWRKELHENVLDPLVVRLTENVFQIE